MKLRWYQFSLRTMFIVMTLAAVLMSMLSGPLRDYRWEQAVLDAIGRGNVMVQSKYVPAFGRTLLSIVLGDAIYGRVASLTFVAAPPADFDLARLDDFSHLRELSLARMPLDDDRLAGLSRLAGLETLDLCGTRITDAGLKHIEGLKQLQRVSTAGTKVTYAGLKRLQPKLPDAEDLCQARAIGELELIGASAHEEDGSNGQYYDHVRMKRRFRNADLEHLQHLPRLRKLYLGSEAKDESLLMLKHLKALECLTISSWQVEGEGLQHLAGLNNLKILCLQNVRFNEDGVSKLGELKNLEELQLSGSHFTGLYLKHLEQLPRLRKLVIDRAPYIYDIDLPSLAEMKTLEELTLTGVRVSDAGAARLRTMLPNVRIDISRETHRHSVNLGPSEKLGLPAEAVDALWAGEYERLAEVCKELAKSPEAPWQVDLWLGHARQLTGRWAEAVEAYKAALHKLDRELAKARNASQGNQPNREEEQLAVDWAQLAALVGRIELDELNDPAAAVETLARTLRHIPELDRPVGTLADETAKVIEPLQSPRSSRPETARSRTYWMHTLETYQQLAEAHERQGNVEAAIECWIRIRLRNMVTGTARVPVYLSHIARLWSRLPPDRPTPPMPIFLTPTPEQPKIDLQPASGQSRLACWNRGNTWRRYAILPPPGMCIDVLKITCQGDDENASAQNTGQERVRCWSGVVTHRGNQLPPLLDQSEDAGTKSWIREFHPETPDDTDLMVMEVCSESTKKVAISCTFRPRSESRTRPKQTGANLGSRISSRIDVFSPVAADTSRFTRSQHKASVLARMADGRLLAAFTTDDDKILLTRSRDGVEWEEPYEYSGNSVFTTYVPSLTVDDNGVIWMLYVSKRPGFDRFSTGHFYLWMASSKDGRTWKTPTPVRTPHCPRYHTTATITRDPDGQYWIFRDGCAGSGDSPGDIRELVPIDIPIRGDSVFPINPHAIFDATGRCHLVFDDFGNTLQYTFSDDMHTWSTFKTLGEKTKNSPISHPQLILDDDRVALIYMTPQGIKLRRGMMTPDGLRLSEPQQIVDHRLMIGGFRMLRDEDTVYFQVQGNPPLLLQADIDALLDSR